MVFLLLCHLKCINCQSFACSGAPPTGHLDVVCLLVSQGAEISCKDKRGYTPLHTAASSGQIAVVKHLLNLAVEVRAHTLNICCFYHFCKNNCHTQPVLAVITGLVDLVSNNR